MVKFYSTEEAAKMLNVKKNRLQRAVWTRKLRTPLVAPGRSFLWTQNDIENAAAYFGIVYQNVEREFSGAVFG